MMTEITVQPRQCLWRDGPLFVSDTRQRQRDKPIEYAVAKFRLRCLALIKRRAAKTPLVFSVPRAEVSYDPSMRGFTVYVIWEQAPSPDEKTYVVGAPK